MIRINGVDYNSTINDNNSPGFGFGVNQMMDNPNLYEPQRTNNFEFIVPEFNTTDLVKAGLSEAEIAAGDSTLKNCGDVLRISMQRAFVPGFAQSSLQVKRGNTTIKYAGSPDFGNGGQISLNQFIGSDAYEVLAAWQNLSYNVATEKVGLASDYKKLAWICEYTPDYQLVRKWKLYGCWVSDLKTDDLSYDNNSTVKITATIQYDKAQIDYSDQ